MNFLTSIFKEKPSKVAKCGAFKCNNYFELKNPDAPQPAIYICPQCEKRFNQGIVQTVHANTGRLEGSFNALDNLKGHKENGRKADDRR